jgi:glycosyltransferase involved in cell wall biosynthesis
MGMAIPVLHGVAGESAGIVEAEDVGVVFEPENVDALLAGLRRLADDDALYQRLRANGPAAARRYDRANLAARMLKVLLGVRAGVGPR